MHSLIVLIILASAQTLMAAFSHAQSGLEDLSTFRDCDDCPEMVVLPAGSFMMGATPQERKDMFIGFVPAEHPSHQVTISQRFALGRFEVTTREFDVFVQESATLVGGTCGIRLIESGPLAQKFEGKVHPDNGKDNMGPFHVFITNGSYAQPGLPVTADQPAVCVSRLEIDAYLTWLSAKTGRQYRLPSEAEWENAARAGTSTIGFWGDNWRNVCRFANFGDRNSGYQAGMAAPCGEDIRPDWTADVGSYQPNPWGLHDMAGNVQELTADCWHPNYEGAPSDGSARSKPDCTLFVARGGDYELLHISMRASERLFYGYVPEQSAVEGPDAGDSGRSNVLGFRVAVTVD